MGISLTSVHKFKLVQVHFHTAIHHFVDETLMVVEWRFWQEDQIDTDDELPERWLSETHEIPFHPLSPVKHTVNYVLMWKAYISFTASNLDIIAHCLKPEFLFWPFDAPQALFLLVLPE